MPTKKRQQKEFRSSENNSSNGIMSKYSSLPEKKAEEGKMDGQNRQLMEKEKPWGMGKEWDLAQENILKEILGWNKIRLPSGAMLTSKQRQIMSKPEAVEIVTRSLEKIVHDQLGQLEPVWRDLSKNELAVEAQRETNNKLTDNFRNEWKNATREKLEFVCLQNYKKQMWFRKKGYKTKMDAIELKNKKELLEAARHRAEVVKKHSLLVADLQKQKKREDTLRAKIVTTRAIARLPEESFDTQLVPEEEPSERCMELVPVLLPEEDLVPEEPLVDNDDSLVAAVVTLSDSEDEGDEGDESSDGYESETEEDANFNSDFFLSLL